MSIVRHPERVVYPWSQTVGYGLQLFSQDPVGLQTDDPFSEHVGIEAKNVDRKMCMRLEESSDHMYPVPCAGRKETREASEASSSVFSSERDTEEDNSPCMSRTVSFRTSTQRVFPSDSENEKETVASIGDNDSLDGQAKLASEGWQTLMLIHNVNTSKAALEKKLRALSQTRSYSKDQLKRLLVDLFSKEGLEPSLWKILDEELEQLGNFLGGCEEPALSLSDSVSCVAMQPEDAPERSAIQLKCDVKTDLVEDLGSSDMRKKQALLTWTSPSHKLLQTRASSFPQLNLEVKKNAAENLAQSKKQVVLNINSSKILRRRFVSAGSDKKDECSSTPEMH